MFTGSIPHVPTTFSRSKHWLKHQLPWFNRRFLKHVKAPSSLMKPPYLLLKFPRPEAAPTRRPLDQELTRLGDKATSEMAWNKSHGQLPATKFPDAVAQWLETIVKKNIASNWCSSGIIWTNRQWISVDYISNMRRYMNWLIWHPQSNNIYNIQFNRYPASGITEWIHERMVDTHSFFFWSQVWTRQKARQSVLEHHYF